jgi:hypothetical protein
MKIKRQTIFLIAGLLLLAASGFLFSRRAIPVSSQSQAMALSDWIYRSGGNLNVMVTYPEKLETGRKNLITVAYQADKALESVLANGVVFDLQLDMLKTVIQPQKRMLIPVESGRKTFVWEVEPFIAGFSEASISMALGDKTLSGNYAITTQQRIDFSMEIAESTAATRGELSIWGFICLGGGLLSLLAAYLLNKKKPPLKKRK